MHIKAYLAGPDVFLPNARENARLKVEICARHGITGRSPLNEDLLRNETMSDDEVWLALFKKDEAMMEECHIVIANLTPFRGPSADSGTLVELGWFRGRGRPVFGYSNSATPFSERSQRHLKAFPDPLPGLSVEGFGLPDNLMVPGAVLAGGGFPMLTPHDGADRSFDALDVFERCVEVAAYKMNLRPRPQWLNA